MKTTAPASCGPMREIALLIEDARPALATGTDAINAAVRGATMIPSPSPKTIVAGRKSTRYDTGGRTLEAECGFRVQAAEVAGTRAYRRHAAAITSGPTIRKGRAPPAREHHVRTGVPPLALLTVDGAERESPDRDADDDCAQPVEAGWRPLCAALGHVAPGGVDGDGCDRNVDEEGRAPRNRVDQ